MLVERNCNGTTVFSKLVWNMLPGQVGVLISAQGSSPEARARREGTLDGVVVCGRVENTALCKRGPSI